MRRPGRDQPPARETPHPAVGGHRTQGEVPHRIVGRRGPPHPGGGRDDIWRRNPKCREIPLEYSY